MYVFTYLSDEAGAATISHSGLCLRAPRCKSSDRSDVVVQGVEWRPYNY